MNERAAGAPLRSPGGAGGTSGTRVLALAWARFQPRTVMLATALGGAAVFVQSQRLAAHRLLLPVRYVHALLQTWLLLNRHSPELVIVVAPPVFAPLTAWMWCLRHRRPFIVDCHPPDAFDSPRWAWARPVLRFILRRALLTLCHTPDNLQVARSSGARAELVIDDVPSSDEADPDAATSGAQVVVAGAFDGNEPVAEALEAARRMPGVRFAFTGDPVLLSPDLRGSVPPNVSLTGFLPYSRFLAELKAAQVVAVFSGDRHIFTPRAAFETVGMGRPLVLLDLRGVRATFGDAALYTSAKSDGMARSITLALANSNYWASRSRHKALELNARHHSGMIALTDAAATGLAPRVLVLTQHSLARRAHARRNVLELAQQGYVVDIVCTEPIPPGDIPAECADLIHFHALALDHRRRGLGRYLFEYVSFLAWAIVRTTGLGLRHRYESVLVDNMPDILVFGAPLPRIRGTRLVFNMFELTPEMLSARLSGWKGRFLNRIARMVERRAIRAADAVITVSEPCRTVLRERGVPERKLHVVVNSVDLPRELEADCPGDSAGRYLVTHGTLVERYGTHLAIEALARLRDGWPDLRLQVIGSGEDLPRLRRLAADLAVADRVDFTGNLGWTEVQRRITGAELGIVAVLPDGYGKLLLPTKLLEYAAASTPAVCPRLPAIQAYFPDDAVTYFTPGSVEELTNGICTLLMDQTLSARRAMRAQQVASAISWRTQRPNFLEAMGICLGQAVCAPPSLTADRSDSSRTANPGAW